MLLYTSPAAAGTYQFNLTFLPEFFTWNDAGNAITLLRVETQEDGVLHDMNNLSIAAVDGFMFAGPLAANQHAVRLADGHIEGKNTTITVTTVAAAAINFFGSSDNIGTVPFMLKNAAILALNPTTFMDFTALFIPAMATVTDRAEVEFKDGHKQTFDIADLTAISSSYQDAQGIIINNIQSYIHKATIVCAAAHPAYVLSVALKRELQTQ